MKKIMLCGRPNCGGCPHIEEAEKDTGKDTIYMCDGDRTIALNKKQQQELAKYLCKRLEPMCKCAICNP